MKMRGNKKKRPVHIPVSKPSKKEKEAGKAAQEKKKREPVGEPASEKQTPGTTEKPLEYDELLDTLKRLKAEYANYQKRIEREREEWRETSARGVFGKILPVLDNLERALVSSKEHADTDQLQSGVELILKQFRQTLTAEGIEPLESVGKKFDPRFHDAVMLKETGEVPPQTIVSEVVRGYMMGDKVLRPASVVVSRPPQVEQEERQENTEPAE